MNNNGLNSYTTNERSSQASILSLICIFSQELHVFAFESSSLGDGKRMYLVSSYDVFWNYYRLVHTLNFNG